MFCEPQQALQGSVSRPKAIGCICVLKKPSVVHYAVLYVTMLARVVEDGTCQCCVDVGVYVFATFVMSGSSFTVEIRTEF